MIGVIIGVVASVALRIGFFSSGLWVVFALVALTVAYLRPSWLFAMLAMIAGITLGTFRVAGEIQGREVLERHVGEVVEIAGVVQGDVAEEGSEEETLESGEVVYEGGVAKFKLGELTMHGANIRGVIYITGSIKGLERGERLTVKGRLSEGFGGYAGAIFTAEAIERAKPERKQLTLRLREAMAGSIMRMMRGEDFNREIEKETGEAEEDSAEDAASGECEGKLGLAYLLGLKNGLDAETVEMLRAVGLTHLVVASGTHLGILVEFFKKYFGKVSRFAGLFFSLLFIFGFGEMIGWTASITRAAIVAGVTLLGWYVGQKFEAWRVIVLAIAITLMIEPMYVVDVGWLLSFGSFIGIMILMPELVEIFHGRKEKGKFVRGKKPTAVEEIILATVAATVMVAPILLYFFGSFSLISVVANLLILPTMPVAMGLTFLTGMVGFLPEVGVLRIVQWCVVKITTLLLRYHLEVMGFFAKQTSFIIEMPSGKTGVFLAYIPVLGLIIVANLLRATKRRKMTRKIQAHPEKYIPIS